MIERATVLRCENVNNQTFILHPGQGSMLTGAGGSMAPKL